MVFSIIPVHNFPNENIAWITSILIIIIFILEIRILINQNLAKKEEDRGTLLLILGSIFIPLILIITFSYLDIGLIDTSISYLGLFLLLGGFMLRQYAIFTLGKFFIPIIAKQKSQPLIKNGPYRYIRHPSYTGLLMELGGFALALSNIAGFILVLFLLLPALIYRINKEEAFLLRNLRSYDNYMKKTKRLIPFIY